MKYNICNVNIGSTQGRTKKLATQPVFIDLKT